jgi:hypothetical protein
MLLPICVCYEHARAKNAKLDFAVAVLGTVCILMCGARGACLSLIAYFIIRAIAAVDIRRIHIKGAIEFFLLILACALLVIYYDEILTTVVKLLENAGINSRFIQKLQEGTLMKDYARAELTEAIWRGLQWNPLGFGLFGDRYVIGTFGYGRYTYSHNIVTELLCDFGIVVGTLLLVFVFWRIGKMIFMLRNRTELGLLLALLPYGVFQLFFSSSYLENVAFFIVMGLCVSERRSIPLKTGDGK